MIFPSTPLSREPPGSAYMQGETVWAGIVSRVYTTIIAADKGITPPNVDAVEWDEEAKRMFGAEGEHAVPLGFNPDAFYQVIKQVGNCEQRRQVTRSSMASRLDVLA